MKVKQNRCIGITKNKKICNRIIYGDNIYCKSHKHKKKNNLNSIKSIIKREIVKTISHNSKELLTNTEQILIHKAKSYLTNSFTKCYICGSDKLLTIDHIIPLINTEKNEYGKDNDANKIICCNICNRKKSNKGINHIKNELKIYNKNKKELYNKIIAINTIYLLKDKLILKKIYLYNLSSYILNNMLNIFQKILVNTTKILIC